MGALKSVNMFLYSFITETVFIGKSTLKFTHSKNNIMNAINDNQQMENQPESNN